MRKVWAFVMILGLVLTCACGKDTDMPMQPDELLVEALHLAVWGGRRYAMQLRLDEQRMQQWAAQMEALCLARLSPAN